MLLTTMKKLLMKKALFSRKIAEKEGMFVGYTSGAYASYKTLNKSNIFDKIAL